VHGNCTKSVTSIPQVQWLGTEQVRRFHRGAAGHSKQSARL
jgi:hypothetical protein